MITHNPLHRSGRADFPHQMCSNTFDAICVPEKYVAPSGQILWNQRDGWPGHHINNASKLAQERH